MASGTAPLLSVTRTASALSPEGLAILGRALADPIRTRILLLLAAGRACCSGLDVGVPVQPDDAGICVCELEAVLGLRQSLVSYHLRLLREAGLVREERRGRWSFYSLNRRALRDFAGGLDNLAVHEPLRAAGAGTGAAEAVVVSGKEGETMGCCCGGSCGGGSGGCC